MTFATADALGGIDAIPEACQGPFAVVYCGAFFHLLDESDQIRLAELAFAYVYRVWPNLSLQTVSLPPSPICTPSPTWMHSATPSIESQCARAGRAFL